MARIPNSTIEQIKSRADILDVVSDVVQLRQRGRNYFGLCPFHEEKTPSFSVNPSMGIFHCFGCGKGGNAVTFVMEYERIEYIEALKRLAERYNIQIDWEETGDDTEKGEIVLLYELHDIATEFYHKQLFSDKGKVALSYLNERGFTDSLIRQFSIGFATDDWENLFRKIDPNRFKPGVLEKSGLFGRKENNRFYDRFRNRIMFTIHNLAGRTVAFGGRTMDQNESAKYINSQETPIYFKSGILYGLYFSKDYIQKSGTAVIVEGYTDFLRMYMSGVQNVVAGSGTALTFHHAKALKRFTSQTILCYDGDEAGQNATERAGFILLKEGFDVKAISLPEKDDPDSFLKTHPVLDFQQLYKNAPDFLTFYIQRHQQEFTSTALKTLFIEKTIAELADIKNPITRELIVREIAERLHINEELIYHQIRFNQRYKDARTKVLSPDNTGKMTITLVSATDKAEYELLKIILAGHRSLLEIISINLTSDNFRNPILRKIAGRLLDRLLPKGSFRKIDKPIQPADLFNEEWSAQEKFYLSRLIIDSEPVRELSDISDFEKLTEDCIVVLLTVDIGQEIRNLREMIKSADKKGEEAAGLVLELSKLRGKRREIERQFRSSFHRN